MLIVNKIIISCFEIEILIPNKILNTFIFKFLKDIKLMKNNNIK